MARVCRVLRISKSGFYEARQRAIEKRVISPVLIRLRAAFAASGGAYGSRRLREVLCRQQVNIGRFKVRRLMKENGLKPVWKRKFVHTTDSRHELPVAPNLLARQFSVTIPNQAWVADITYIRTGSGWLYLATVLDLYSRKIVGWSMAPHMHTELVNSALQLAVAQRSPKPGLIMHTDRGAQYASASHRELLSRHGMRQSMSRKGDCWDNAVMERFFLSLKMERVWRKKYANQAEAIKDVTDYIVRFYNSERLHSTLGYKAPNEYERLAG